MFKTIDNNNNINLNTFHTIVNMTTIIRYLYRLLKFTFSDYIDFVRIINMR